MSAVRKQQRPRTGAFVQGQISQIVTIRFEMNEIAHLSELIASTNETYVDDAVKAILMSVATSPPSQLMLLRQTHLTLLADFANRIDSVFKAKIAEAEKAAGEEITQYLLERGITE